MMRIGVLGAALALTVSAAAWSAQAAQGSAQDAAADQVTAAENLKYVEMSRAVDARNAARKQAYEAALAAYEAALAQRASDLAATESAYAKAKADWEADVQACRAGDYSRCQP